ncbi:MAG: hypothetical protein WC506_03505 [Candidatus Micrarchaeia archaeon]
MAVVLIIALVSIALLGFFPGLAGDAKITQSDSYWRGEARPFQIKDHVQSGTTLSLVMLNSESEALTITAMAVGNGTIGNSTTITFAGGQQKTIGNFTGLTSCTAGDTYEYQVNISYTTGSGLSKLEQGTKTLIGKCA